MPTEQNQTAKPYTVTVTRDGRWWMVAIPALDGLTQARRYAEVETMAREYIALETGTPIDDVRVEVADTSVVPYGELNASLRRLRDDRALLRSVEGRITARSRELAAGLSGAGVPVRDIGAMLDVSFQRASQIINEHQKSNA